MWYNERNGKSQKEKRMSDGKGELFADNMKVETEAQREEKQVSVMSQQTAPMVRDTSGAGMLALLVERGADLATLEKFMDLRDREEAKEAKANFDRHFAAMQGDFKPVPKRDEAKDGSGKVLYAYASLEDIVKTNGRAISSHGFSYSFREEDLAERNVTRFFLIVTGWGHTKETYVDLPTGGAKAPLMNGAQSSRGLQSYGQRYAMIAGFGFVMEDEDDDGQSILTFEAGVQYAEEIKLLRESTTIEELRANYKTVWTNRPEEGKKILYQERLNCEKKLNGGRK